VLVSVWHGEAGGCIVTGIEYSDEPQICASRSSSRCCLSESDAAAVETEGVLELRPAKNVTQFGRVDQQLDGKERLSWELLSLVPSAVTSHKFTPRGRAVVVA
jgi:hypothetical protein